MCIMCNKRAVRRRKREGLKPKIRKETIHKKTDEMKVSADIENLKYDAKGLIPAIVQDAATRVVLMQGYMNAESLQKTLETGKACFFSRSRGRLWTKGEESGHFLLVQDILSDCDQDSLLVKATPVGPTCHTGSDTCWGEEYSGRFSVLSSGLPLPPQGRRSQGVLHGAPDRPGHQQGGPKGRRGGGRSGHRGQGRQPRPVP